MLRKGKDDNNKNNFNSSTLSINQSNQSQYEGVKTSSRKEYLWLKRVKVYCDMSVGKQRSHIIVTLIAIFFFTLAVIILKTMITYYIHMLINEEVNNYYAMYEDLPDRRGLIGQDRLDSYLPDKESQSKMKTISRDPYIFLYENFLTKEECAKIIAASNEIRLSRNITRDSGIQTDPNTKIESGDLSQNSSAHSMPFTYRNSTNVWIESSHKVIKPIDTKLQNVLGSSLREYEPSEVKEYREGQYYLPHEDTLYTIPTDRFGTAVIFLQHAEDGGEFTFLGPHRLSAEPPALGTYDNEGDDVQIANASTPQAEEYMKKIMTKGSAILQQMTRNSKVFAHIKSCGNSEYTYKLRTGDMLVFYYFPRKEQPASCILGLEACITLFGMIKYCSFNKNCVLGDHRLVHASCPIFKGTKYSLTYWMSSTIGN